MCCIVLSCTIIKGPTQPKKQKAPEGNPPPYESVCILHLSFTRSSPNAVYQEPA
jgi:hypothetical protein